MLGQGIAATQAVVKDWHANGVSESEVASALDTLTGSYVVALSTTGSVAGQILSFMQRGFPPEYIDTYPEVLRKVTTEQVNRAIQTYLDPESEIVVSAGSLDAAPQTAGRTIQVHLDTPDSAWRIAIDQIYQSEAGLIVISKASRGEMMAAQVISTVSDQVQIDVDPNLPVKHYLLGKTWNWGDTSQLEPIESLKSIEDKLAAAKLIYQSAGTTAKP